MENLPNFLSKQAIDYLTGQIAYLRKEITASRHLPATLKEKDIEFIEQRLKEELVTRYKKDIETDRKAQTYINIEDFYIGKVKLTSEERENGNLWKENKNTLYPSDYGVGAIVMALKLKLYTPPTRIADGVFDDFRFEEIEEDDDIEPDEKLQNHIENMAKKQNQSRVKGLKPVLKNNDNTGVHMYWTEENKTLINTLINSAEDWLGRALTSEEITGYIFIDKYANKISDYYADIELSGRQYSISYLRHIVGVIMKYFLFKQKMAEKIIEFKRRKDKTISKKNDKTYTECHEKFMEMKNAFDKLCLLENDQRDENSLTAKQLEKWIDIPDLESLFLYWNEKYKDSKNIQDDINGLLCAVHCCGALRTSFYVNLKVYTTQEEIEEVAKSEWGDDFGGSNGRSWFPWSHNFVYVGENYNFSDVCMVFDKISGFYYVNSDKVSSKRSYQAFEKMMIPLDAGLKTAIKTSLKRHKRETLFDKGAKTNAMFITNLSKACKKQTDNQVLRISYETNRYVEVAICQSKTHQFSRDCWKLRHGVEIVLSTYVKMYKMIPSLMQKVKNHFAEQKNPEPMIQSYNEVEKSLLSLNLTPDQREYLLLMMQPKTERQQQTIERVREIGRESNKRYVERNAELVKARDYCRKLNVRGILKEHVQDAYCQKYNICWTENGFKIEQDTQECKEVEKLFE